MTENDLFNEVNAIVRMRIDQGRIAKASWVTQEVVNAHNDISGSDVEWYQLCAYTKIRDVVRECVNRYKVKPTLEKDEQLLLGQQFEHLQVAYAVIRKDEPVFVPIHLLTSDEIEAKAIELEKMGTGCFKHADELRRYSREQEGVA
jgi:hypothetical protein